MYIFIATIIMYAVITALICSLSKQIRNIECDIFDILNKISNMKLYSNIEQINNEQKQSPKKEVKIWEEKNI